MTNNTEMCKRYGICKHIAMNEYQKALRGAKAQEFRIRNRMNFAPAKSPTIGRTFCSC